uniref:Uncharacterized protein n=1 Tax=Moniliophthora roreri TaxID=221103 RepID=A0A0W0FSR0_MONRR
MQSNSTEIKVKAGNLLIKSSLADKQY